MEDEEFEHEIDPKDIAIRRLQSTIALMAGVHGSDGSKEPHCIYCGMEWPCYTSRLARRAATAWKII